jgi:hypothetical protein
MPDLRSDTNNPNNPSYGHPERHPHYGRSWMDPAPGSDGDDDEESSYGMTPAPEDQGDTRLEAGKPIPVWLFDHS